MRRARDPRAAGCCHRCHLSLLGAGRWEPLLWRRAGAGGSHLSLPLSLFLFLRGCRNKQNTDAQAFTPFTIARQLYRAYAAVCCLIGCSDRIVLLMYVNLVKCEVRGATVLIRLIEYVGFEGRVTILKVVVGGNHVSAGPFGLTASRGGSNA